MILLDTNVVSEAMKPEPHPSVRDWLDAQAAETVFLSSVTIAELLFGIGALPRGKRRRRGSDRQRGYRLRGLGVEDKTDRNLRDVPVERDDLKVGIGIQSEPREERRKGDRLVRHRLPIGVVPARRDSPNIGAA